MKTKILLPITILFFATTTANAQINEGSYLLGGSASYTNSKYQAAPTSESESASSSFNIQFGKVIKNYTLIGIIGSFSGNTNLTKDFKVYQYSAGVFYRKYKPLGSNFYFFAEIDATFQHSSNFASYYFPDVNEYLSINTNGVEFNFTPGISYSVSKKFQVELSLPNIAGISYTGIKTIDSDLPPGIKPQTANSFSANVSLINNNLLNNFGIGFKFFLGK